MRFLFRLSLMASILLVAGYSASAAECQDPQMPARKLRSTKLDETRQLGGDKVEVSTTYYDERYGNGPGMPGQGMARYHCTKDKSTGCYTNCQAHEVEEFGKDNPKLKEKAELIDCAQSGNQECRMKYMKSIVREGGFFGQ